MPTREIGHGLTDGSAEVSADVQVIAMRDQSGNRSRNTAAQRVPLLTVPAGNVLCHDPADLLELPAGKQMPAPRHQATHLTWKRRLGRPQ
jgi:hypothetical protein